MTSLLEKEIREYEEKKSIVMINLITKENIVGVIQEHDNDTIAIERTNLAKNKINTLIQIKHIVRFNQVPEIQ